MWQSASTLQRENGRRVQRRPVLLYIVQSVLPMLLLQWSVVAPNNHKFTR